MSSSATLKLFFVSRYLAFEKSSVNQQLLLLLAIDRIASHLLPKNKLDPGQSLTFSKRITVQ